MNTYLKIDVLVFIFLFVMGILFGAGIYNAVYTTPFKEVTYVNFTTSDPITHCYRGDTGWVYIYDEEMPIIRMTEIDKPLKMIPDYCKSDVTRHRVDV